MGEIADMMIGGIMCEMCGEGLPCVTSGTPETCEDFGVPMYCSIVCAEDRGAGEAQVCNH